MQPGTTQEAIDQLVAQLLETFLLHDPEFQATFQSPETQQVFLTLVRVRDMADSACTRAQTVRHRAGVCSQMFCMGLCVHMLGVQKTLLSPLQLDATKRCSMAHLVMKLHFLLQIWSKPGMAMAQSFYSSACWSQRAVVCSSKTCHPVHEHLPPGR